MEDSGPLPVWLANEVLEPLIAYKGPADLGSGSAERSLSPLPPLPFYQLVGSKTEVGPGITSLFFDHTQPKPELIGRGSFGSAMLLQDKTSVVKYMDIGTDRFRNAFHREVYALQLLGSHPNIVALKGWREDISPDDQGNQYGYLEIEYARGKTVREWLEDHRTDPGINLKSLWYPFVQTLLLTIEYIHSKGVHHLDLHPSNVMVYITPKYKTLKVIDFGLSCSRESWFPGNAKCGTPGNVAYYTGFVSTEAASESIPFTAKDMRMMDLWSVGALAHLWWFGRPPYAETWRPPNAKAAAYSWLYFCSTNKAKYPPTLDPDDSDHPEAIEAMRQLLSNPLVGDKKKGWVPGETVELPDNLRTLAPPDTLWPPQPS